MSRIPLLPLWEFPNTSPAFYESESFTAQEMTAKAYGAMRNMVADYNKFAEEINREIETFTGSSNAEVQNFKESVEQRLRCKFEDLDARMGEIKAETLRYAAEHLENAAPGALPVISEADEGKLLQVIGGKWAAAIPAFVYDPVTEAISLTIVGGAEQ